MKLTFISDYLVKTAFFIFVAFYSMQAFSYEETKVEIYIKSLFPYKDGAFNLWNTKDSPYHCISNLKDSTSLKLLNHAKNEILLNSPIYIEDCLNWEDKNATQNKSSIVILMYDDFSKINENSTFRRIFSGFGNKGDISDERIEFLNKGNISIYIYYTEENREEVPKAAIVLQKLPKNNDISVRDFLRKSSRIFYHIILSSSGEIDSIENTISNINYKGHYISYIDKHIIQHAYKLSGKNIKYSKAHSILSNELSKKLNNSD